MADSSIHGAVKAHVVKVLREHLPKDRYDDDGGTVGTYCTCGGWEGDYFADGEAGPYDDHLADALMPLFAPTVPARDGVSPPAQAVRP